MSTMRILGLGLAGLVAIVALYVLGAYLRLYGSGESAGEPTLARVPAEVVAARQRKEQRAAASLSPAPSKQILFGDFHVHSTYSTDAFLWSLPMSQGDGAHPVADACDYARFCSGLDFWSINDHAEASTPRKWRETVRALRECQAVAGDDANPDVAAFLGWEWSQVGLTAEEHYGHKNVIVKELEPAAIPARAIGAGGLATRGLRGAPLPWYLPFLDFSERERYFDFVQFMEEVQDVPFCEEGVPSPELSDECYESAMTPAELFAKLSEWRASGVETLVIPHGNTWGYYSPPGISWDKQLVGAMHDPEQQFLIEVMSGHGNSEEYRDWRAARPGPDGALVCPEPTPGYLPSCWRAGQLIQQRCLDAGEPLQVCEERAARARQLYVDAGASGYHVVPGTEFEEWLGSGQCLDCFRPSFNYRPGASTQYALAVSNFDQAEPRRFRFGLLASSDNHRARPGTGYKPVDRLRTTEANGPPNPTWRGRTFPKQEPLSEPVAIQPGDVSAAFAIFESERQSSFFMTGGLVAVHADGRSRGQIWEALRRKEVYGTSGPRILLWFHLLNAELPDGSYRPAPMGSEVVGRETPTFEVRAVGSLRQEPGCPESSASALSAERLERLCGGECYHPSDERRLITRIEVVRIRPQERPGEPMAPLIEDPWRVFPCAPDPSGCVVRFTDPTWRDAGRDTVYYVRAVEEPSPVINAGNLRCRIDESGECVEVDPCYGDYRTPVTESCAEPSEERAWSSPIFVDAS
jgi:hypothetical protein